MKILKVLVIIFAFISIGFFFFSNNQADPDIWGHLKYGQDTYESRQLMRNDVYSYSSYGAKWINHEWLSELIFYTIFRFTKSAGLIIFKMTIGLALTLILYISISRQTKSFFLKWIFLLLCLGVIDYGFMTRPQIFTYLFFAAFVFFIDRFERSANPKWLFSMPLIALLWCNLHGGFIVGIGLLLIYSLYKLFKKEASKELLFVCTLSILATFINPYGVSLWGFLFMALSTSRIFIYEWLKLSFYHLYLFRDFFILLFITILGVIFAKTKRLIYEVAFLFMGALYALHHRRHIVLFAILACVYVPKYLDSVGKKWLLKFEKRISKRVFTLLILCLSLLLFISSFKGKTHPFKIEIPQNAYPVNAIGFLNDNQITGNMFCNFNWAQMCIRELPETNKVFFDGRYRTVYSEDLIKSYFEVLNWKRNYKNYLSRFEETDIIFIHPCDPMSFTVVKDPDWITVYSSATASIFLKKNKKNALYIRKFESGKLIRNERKGPFFLSASYRAR